MRQAIATLRASEATELNHDGRDDLVRRIGDLSLARRDMLSALGMVGLVYRPNPGVAWLDDDAAFDPGRVDTTPRPVDLDD